MEQLESEFYATVKFQILVMVVFINFDTSFHLLRYKWMTYGEAGTARTAIGSGLVNHGIPKVNNRMPRD